MSPFFDETSTWPYSIDSTNLTVRPHRTWKEMAGPANKCQAAHPSSSRTVSVPTPPQAASFPPASHSLVSAGRRYAASPHAPGRPYRYHLSSPEATRTPDAMDFSTASTSSPHGAACWLDPWSKARSQRARAHHRAEPAGPHSPPPPPSRSSGHAAGPRVGAGAEPARRGDGRCCSGQADVRRGRVCLRRRTARVRLPPRSPGEYRRSVRRCSIWCLTRWMVDWKIGPCCSRRRGRGCPLRGIVVRESGTLRWLGANLLGAENLKSRQRLLLRLSVYCRTIVTGTSSAFVYSKLAIAIWVIDEVHAQHFHSFLVSSLLISYRRFGISYGVYGWNVESAERYSEVTDLWLGVLGWWYTIQIIRLIS
jgi:hypothetical protein